MTEARELRRLRRWSRAVHFKVACDAEGTGWHVIDPQSGGIVGKLGIVDKGHLQLADIERVVPRRLKAAGLFGKRQLRLPT